MDWFKENLGLGLTENDASSLSPALKRLTKTIDAPAYAHLTTEFLTQQFNPSTPNNSRVHYLVCICANVSYNF
jgi:hypothetical protein